MSFIVSSINNISLKIIPIVIIITCLFTIYNSFTARLLITEQGSAVRLLKKNITRSEMFMYNIVLCIIIIIISGIHLFSV